MELNPRTNKQFQEIKNQGVLIKKTTVPLHFEFSKQIRMQKKSTGGRMKGEQSTKQILGLVNFPTEQYKMKFGNVDIKNQIHIEPVSYKNLNAKNGEEEEEKKIQRHFMKKRTIEYNKVIIRPQKLKKKQFIVNIPIKTSKTGVMRKQNQHEHFVLEFTNKEGRLSLVTEFQQANTEIVVPENKRQRNIEEAVQLQKQILDARRQSPGFRKNNEEQEQRPQLPSIQQL